MVAVIDFSSKTKTANVLANNLAKVYNTHKSGFMAFVRSYFPGFSLQDAEEIYNDSFLVTYNDIQTGKLNNLTCSLQTYINQVGKYKIFDFYKKKKIQTDYFEDIPVSYILGGRIDEIWENATSERKIEIYTFIEKMDDVKCKKIIFAYYYDGLSMDAIAKGMDMKNADVAKTTKSRCLRKMKKILNELLVKKGV